MSMNSTAQGAVKYHLKHLNANEYVVLERRRHWFSIVQRGGLLLILAVILVILGLAALIIPIDNPWLKGGAVLIPLLFGLGYIGWCLLDWTNDFFILTNQRVVFIDKTVGIQEQQSQAPMNKVHNVRIEFPGRIAQTLDFGNLALDTAGLGVLSLTSLPKPRYLREKILEVRRQVNQEALPVREERRRAVLRDKIRGVDDPNDKPMEAPFVNPQEVGLDRFNILFPHRPQRQGETVVWHRHLLFLLKDELRALGALALVIIIWLLTIWATRLMATPSDPYAIANNSANGLLDTLNTVVSYIAIAALIIIAFFVWYVYENWRNSKYSLTHDRVLTVEKKPLGGREVVKETMFSRITDVSYTIKNPIAVMFNYGTLVIKTPGEATAFYFNEIPDPRAVQQEVTTRLEAQRAREAAQWDNDIVDWLAVFAKYFDHTPALPADRTQVYGSLDNPNQVRRPGSDSFFDI